LFPKTSKNQQGFMKEPEVLCPVLSLYTSWGPQLCVYENRAVWECCAPARRRGAWADDRRVNVPSFSKNRSARVQICIIPEKEECGAVGGKYKKNPVRRAREKGDTKVADPRCGYASADARLRGRLSWLLPLLALPFLPFPTHTMPFFSLLRRLLCFPSAFLNNYTQTQSVAGTKHGSGGDFDLLL
jgi:hypothetical protein